MPAIPLRNGSCLEVERARDYYLSHGPVYRSEQDELPRKSEFEASLCMQFRRASVVPASLKVDFVMQLLPEANLRTVLGLLPLSERIRTAELVSKQWKQALRDQEALSVVDLAADPVWKRQVYYHTAMSSCTPARPCLGWSSSMYTESVVALRFLAKQ